MRPHFRISLLVPLFVGAVIAWSPAVQDGTQVAPYPPVRHVEWVEVPVGGMLLINPAKSDSSGAGSLICPGGSILEVPHWVTGPEPGTEG